MELDEKLLISKTEDLFNLCKKYASPRFSDFLDGAELSTIQRKIYFPDDYTTVFWGGFDNAEKKIMGVFPQWFEPEMGSFPITCIKVEGKFSRKLTHRDYLGSILSLGIATSKLGDIVVSNDFAYVLLHSDIAEYVADNLHKIGNQGVKVTTIDDLTSIKLERKFRTFSSVCASMRLDAVVGAAANISRTQSAALIKAGKVKLNHLENDKPADTVKEGDLISIRGYGRFIPEKINGETRKMRLHITFKQYI